MKRLALVVGSFSLVIAAGVATLAVINVLKPDEPATQSITSDTPDLVATKLVSGLEHPWDIAFLPDNTLLFTERPGELSKLVDVRKTTIGSPIDIKADGEGGLMGMAIDPDFVKNRSVYLCFTSTRGDVRVTRFTLDDDVTELGLRTDIVTGLPAADSGRHSGCQLAFGPDKNLWIGTGDSADESEPQNQNSLGGKVLRVTRDGRPATGNPNGPDRRVYSYGHRNVQALAFYDDVKNGSYGISVEHGSNRDDEVNPLSAGNFGWAPGAGYDESVPMTDKDKFPDAVSSIWSSGSPTIAPSGAAFLKGNQWGRLNGWLAVSVLKNQKLMLLNVNGNSVSGERSLFEKEYGRLRAATSGPDGALYVSTDNGADDTILRIAPKS